MTGALIFAGILLFIVLTMQLGRQPVGRSALLRPVVIAVVVGVIYLRSMPTNGSSLVLAVTGAAIGLVAGLIALACTRFETEGRTLFAICGGGYLAVWLVVLVARVTFIYGVQPHRWWAASVDSFSAAHRLSSNSWTAFFVLQAIAMILVREGGLLLAMARTGTTVSAERRS
jgi:hypothetical protein